MKITRTAVENIEETLSTPGPTTEMRVANGSPIKTSTLLDKMVGVIRRMELELDDTEFDLVLYFGPHGVTLEGQTK